MIAINNIKRYLKNKKGVTLVELVIASSLIVIVLTLAYGMILHINKVYKITYSSYTVDEQLRIFLMNIEREANHARKAEEEETKGAIIIVNQRTLEIYTDVEDDSRPELIRYELDTVKKEIKRSIKSPTGTDYPLKYIGSFKGERVVLANVINQDLFKNLENVREPITGRNQEGRDYRKKIQMKIEINGKESKKPIIVEKQLITKSRAEYGKK